MMNKLMTAAFAVALCTSSAIAIAASPPAPPATPLFTQVDGMAMTVSTNGTLVKAQPVSSSKTLSTLAMGTKVMVLDRTANGMWARVQMGSTAGYVPVKALK
jgi:uncharacterized protein YgiM (DUF1202 family)